MSLVKWTHLLVAILIVFCARSGVGAELYLEVRETLPIFTEPNEKQRSSGQIKSGDVVKHTGRRSKAFIEVVLPAGERAFVKRQDMVKSKIVSRDGAPKRSRSAWGGLLAMAYYSQADRGIQTATDTYYDASAFSGVAPVIGAYYESVINESWSAVVSVSRRQLVMEGNASLRGSVAGSGTEFRLTQEFLSLGIGLKRYMTDRLFGLGYFELAKGTDVKLEVISGTPVNTGDIEEPFFTVCSAGVGYEYFVGSSRLQPYIKVGVIPFADPFILVLEAVAAFDF